MEKSRDSLGHPRHVPSFASFVQVLPKSRTLQRIAVPLEDMHIVANPMLNDSEDCQECFQKAEREGHEPENINTDVRCQWAKWGGKEVAEWKGWKPVRQSRIVAGKLRERTIVTVKYTFLLPFIAS